MKRVVQVILVVAMVVLCFSGAYAGTTERVSVDSYGNEADNSSTYSSISSGGRYVAFASTATNLVPGDTNGFLDIFVHDRATGVTERVSVDSLGNEGNSPSAMPSISAEGRYVAFRSLASNLVSGDTNNTNDVFVHDRVTGVTERVSVDSNGIQANGYCERPSLSADGRYVAFHSYADNLVSGDTNGGWDIFVHDRVTGVTERVSVDSSRNQANGYYSMQASISADGRYVTFRSDATNLVPGDTNGVRDVFVHDRDADEDGIFDEVGGITTERVNVDSNGNQANGDNVCWPYISSDGRYVSFRSRATNLVPGDTNEAQDVFVHDRVTGVTERVSVDSYGNEGNGYSARPSISGDGRYVTFESYATNLVPGDTNNTYDVFVHDRATGMTERVSVDSFGNEANSGGNVPSISGDGRYVAFYSNATNLVPGDTNGAWDVFVRTRDIDFDADGYNELDDCNDNDDSVYPGAPEVKHDGIDQDCNGYDLTIDITKASYVGAEDALKVEATSTLGEGAALELTGIGPMTWRANQLDWSITVQPAGGDPVTVEVCGVEGCESAPTTAE